MEPETTRMEAIERRLAGLERRISRLEAVEPERDPGRTSAPEPGLPPPPAAPWVHRPPVVSSVADRPAAVASVVPGPPAPAPSTPRPVTRLRTPMAAAPAPAAIRAAEPSGPAPAPAPRRASLRELEERFAGRALAWVGGVALVGAAVFFLSLAFSRGWITEPMRVLVGLGAGSASLAAGAVLLARRSPLVGNVLAGVGLGIIEIALLAATRLYGLVPAEVGLLGALAAAIAAAGIAVRFDARSVAAYGLVAALVAPPLVGADPTVLTLLFVAVVLLGTTAVSLFRAWRWLPQIAFVLAAPQLASWLAGGPDVAQALVALAGFWLVNLVAAAGEEVRVRRDDLRPSSATLVVANGAFLLWGLLVVLSGEAAVWRGTAVGVASLAHLLAGAWFLARQGDEHLFGNLVAGSGVALLAIATFLQLGAPAVPVAWAAEAAALAWLAARRLHRWSAAAALVLAGLAIAHLVIVEYPLAIAGLPPDTVFDPPLVHPAGAALVAVLLALLVTGALVPVRWLRSALLATGAVLVTYAATFEVTGPVLAGVLVITAVGTLAADQLLAVGRSDDRLVAALPTVPTPWIATLAAGVPGAVAVALLFATELPPSDVGTPVADPFVNPAFLSLLVVLAGLVAAGALVPVRAVRSGLAGTGILLLAWGLAFQLEGVALVGALAALLPAGVLLGLGIGRLGRDPSGAADDGTPAITDRLAEAAGAVAWGAGAAIGGLVLAPPWLWGQVMPPAIPFTDERALAAALLAGAALGVLAALRDRAGRRAALVAAVVAAAWVVPFEVYADGVVVLWVLLAGAALPAVRRDPAGGVLWTGLAIGLWTGGLLVALGIVVTPDRLWVEDPALRPAALLAGWPLAVAALAAGLLAAPRLPPLARWRTALEAGAGIIALYGISIGVVDVFVRQTGGSIALEELAKQAQVALSVCWTAIGAITLGIGFVRRIPRLRHAGLALLALATAKVFLVDLASMDVAYRALVLAGLGLLLLASAWIATRSHGPRAGRGTLAGGPGATA